MAGSGDSNAAIRALSGIAADASSSKTVISALNELLRSGSEASRVAVVETLDELGPEAAGEISEIER